MPCIKPVSDLRNYGEVLREVAVGQPVFLTKNGRGRYAVMDMEEYREYEKMKAMNRLLAKYTLVRNIPSLWFFYAVILIQLRQFIVKVDYKFRQRHFINKSYALRRQIIH